ncbi:MAG: heme ABC transporter substrate-binding protein IsdE [Lachnospiraceae bacterium]|nr:heme ABC transporter substrate-binding protein IsdE [Lachnospiraceae bacterium]
MKKQRMKLSFLMFLMCGIMAFAFAGCVDQSGGKAQTSAVVAENTAKVKNAADEQSTEETDETANKIEENALEESEEKIEDKEKQVQSEEKIGDKIEEDGKTEQAKTAATSQAQDAEQSKPKEEQRIIATSAATCEIMNRLGIDLVGVPTTTVSTIASRYDGVTRIGTPMAPDMEIIKTLKPTDVIGPDTLEEDLKVKYDNIGVNSTFLDLKSVKGLYDSVTLMGNKYAKEAEAEAMLAEYNTFMKNYNSKHNVTEKPKVLVLIGLPGSYLVGTNKCYAGSLVELAGGVNVFQSDEKDFLNVNPEEILSKDPDIIIRTAHGLPKEALKMFAKEFSENDIWKHFRAVQDGKVYDVDYMIFGMSATFDYSQALSDLEPMLYGE